MGERTISPQERARRLEQSARDRGLVASAPAQRPWRDETVMLATPHRAELAANYVQSLAALIYYDTANATQLVRAGGPFLAYANPMNLPEVRNAMCQAAIDKGVDWLLFVDADAGFEPNLVERLVECADPTDRPVVGALAYAVQKLTVDGSGGWDWAPAPTIYDWGGPNGEPGFFHRYDFPQNTLVKSAATGAHALLIHRTVLEKIKAGDGPVWFNRGTYDPEHGLMGEDFSFCFRLLKAGYPLFVHTGIETTHQQQVWLNSSVYEGMLLVSRMSAAARADEARRQVPDGVIVGE